MSILFLQLFFLEMHRLYHKTYASVKVKKNQGFEGICGSQYVDITVPNIVQLRQSFSYTRLIMKNTAIIVETRPIDPNPGVIRDLDVDIGVGVGVGVSVGVSFSVGGSET
jgi:hypothetical protein